MSVSSGTRLGAYEVGSPLGVGGMGEVYRARDMKLDRDVAIKILSAPPTFPMSRAGSDVSVAWPCAETGMGV